MDIPDIPFRILALAPFTPHQTGSTHDIISVDKNNLNDVVSRLKPFFEIPVPKAICPAGGIDISVEGLKGFRPDNLIPGTPFLSSLVAAQAFLNDSQSKGFSKEQIRTKLQQWPDLPPITIPNNEASSEKKTKQGVEDILKLVALPDQSAKTPDSQSSGAHQIDEILRKAMLHIFSSEDFRRNEGVWRGVKCLLDQEDGGNGHFKLAILPVSEQNLDNTLEDLSSQLIEDPPSLIVVDYPFDSSAVSIKRILKIAELAETVLAPAICAIGPGFFHLDEWGQLDSLPYLPHYLDNQTFAKWRNLAASSTGRWLSVTCNPYHARYPYGPQNQTRGVRFRESEFLFSSPVWAVASLIAQSLQKTGWPTTFSQWQNIRLEDLPLAQKGGSFTTEFWLSEDRIAQFIEAGIIPLIGPKNKDIAFIPGDTTISGDPLSYQMFLSRLSHFILWCKDNLDDGLTPQVLEEQLRQTFALLWEKTGHVEPEDLNITIGSAEVQGRLPVKISLLPSRQILATSQPVELEFFW